MVTRALVALPVGKAAGEKRRNVVGSIGSIGSRMPSRLPLRTCTSLRRSRHILVPMSVLGHAPAVGIPAWFERARGRCTCSRPARLQGGVGGGRRRCFRQASMLGGTLVPKMAHPAEKPSGYSHYEFQGFLADNGGVIS